MRTHRGPRINRRHRRAGAGWAGFGIQSLLLGYEQKRKVRAILIPATWGHVVMISLLSAMAIFFTKIMIYEFIWKPEVGLVTPAIEETEVP